MENNVHRDVYNVDVCTKARRGRRGEGGMQRAKKEKKIGMGQEWGEKSGDEKEEENRRGEIERKNRRVWVTIRERKTMIRGGHADEGKGEEGEREGRRGRVEARRGARRGYAREYRGI